MDIYGAFQMCAIGILVAPVTVKLSRIYPRDYGRNIVFLWTALILSGTLLSRSCRKLFLTKLRRDAGPDD
jgi:hypothetical protein